ncbi:hypothetical protein LEP1GSC172_2648 [Leptospira noguchii]|uniref:Uncharacterized protein n=1 Tax=Leptospira noguchii TaxID=28182 RepID=M6VI29_9LEPT|nr:hypothetical protein LEP1GSC172_2648 [Leptospira noguchii]
MGTTAILSKSSLVKQLGNYHKLRFVCKMMWELTLLEIFYSR